MAPPRRTAAGHSSDWDDELPTMNTPQFAIPTQRTPGHQVQMLTKHDVDLHKVGSSICHDSCRILRTLSTRRVSLQATSSAYGTLGQGDHAHPCCRAGIPATQHTVAGATHQRCRHGACSSLHLISWILMTMISRHGVAVPLSWPMTPTRAIMLWIVGARLSDVPQCCSQVVTDKQSLPRQLDSFFSCCAADRVAHWDMAGACWVMTPSRRTCCGAEYPKARCNLLGQ